MATDVKITKKDNYNTLYELVSNAGLDTETEERLHAFIDHELELIAQRAEKSKKYQHEHNAVSDAMTDMIVATVTNADKPLTVADIVPKVTDATNQKVVYRLGQLFKNGIITKDTQTLKDDNTPARRVTYYSIVTE